MHRIDDIAATPETPLSVLGRGLQQAAPHDHLILLYTGYLSLRTALAPVSSGRGPLLAVLVATFASYAGALAVAHAAGEPAGWRTRRASPRAGAGGCCGSRRWAGSWCRTRCCAT